MALRAIALFLALVTVGVWTLHVSWTVTYLPVTEWPELIRVLRGLSLCEKPWSYQEGWFSYPLPALIRYQSYADCLLSGGTVSTRLYHSRAFWPGLKVSLLIMTAVLFAAQSAFSRSLRTVKNSLAWFRTSLPASRRFVVKELPLASAESLAKPNDHGNPHVRGALRRKQITKLMLDFALKVYGATQVVVAYDCAYSPRDDEYAPGRVVGRRVHHTERDLLHDARDDPLPKEDCLVMMVDQAHYMSVADFDEFRGRPIAYNTIVPRAAAWNTGFSTVCVEGDSTITEHVVEQEATPYKHPLWDVSLHSMWLYGWFSVYRYESVVRYIGDDHAVVFWIPMARIMVPPFVLRMWTWAVTHRPVNRLRRWAAARAVTYTTTGGDVIRLVQVPARGKTTVRQADDYSGNCTELDSAALNTIKTRAQLSNGKMHIMEASDVLRSSSPDRVIPTPDQATMAAVIAAAKVDTTVPPAFVPGESVETRGIKDPVREVEPYPPVVPPAFVAAKHPLTLEALTAAARKAVDKHPRSLPEDVTAAAEQALLLLVSHVGRVAPIDIAEVVAAQTKPLQRARNAAALAQDFALKLGAKLMVKTEATPNPKERGIVTVDTRYGLLLGTYARALYARLKEVLPTWASGRDAEGITAIVRSLMDQHGSGMSTDISGMDNSIGRILAWYYRRFMLAVFGEAEDSDLARMLDEEEDAWVRCPRSQGYAADGATITGNADTTVRNTWLMFFIMTTATQLRRPVPSSELDVSELGAAAGDDAIVPAALYERFKEVCDACGMVVKVDTLPAGMVKFLNRTWLQPASSGHNVPALERALTKLSVYTEADGTPADRTAGMRVADGNTPFFQELIAARERCLGHVGGIASAEKVAIGAWNPDEFDERTTRLAYVAYSVDFGVSVEILEAAAEQLKQAKTEAEYAAIMPLKQRPVPEGKSGPITHVTAPAPKPAKAKAKKQQAGNPSGPRAKSPGASKG